MRLKVENFGLQQAPADNCSSVDETELSADESGRRRLTVGNHNGAVKASVRGRLFPTDTQSFVVEKKDQRKAWPIQLGTSLNSLLAVIFLIDP